jgi:phosphoribosylformylglycinamidine cyclo-ligase
MFQVFNMGHRLEIFTDENAAPQIISIAERFGIDAKVVGRVEESAKKELVLKGSFGELLY